MINNMKTVDIYYCQQLHAKYLVTTQQLLSKHKIPILSMKMDTSWSIFFSWIFLWHHNQQHECLCSLRIGTNNSILVKQLETGKLLTKTANKPKITTLRVKIDMLWLIFFRQNIFCGVIYTSMMDSATSDWVFGAFEKCPILGCTPYVQYFLLCEWLFQK